MEARIFLAAGALAVAATLFPTPAHGSSYRTANFVVEASTPELAEKIGKQAEYYRREFGNSVDRLGNAELVAALVRSSRSGAESWRRRRHELRVRQG